MRNKIIEKISKKIELPNLIELLVYRLSFGELQSLLLVTADLKLKKKKPGDLLKEYLSSRFVKPSDINPIIQRNLELKIFSLLPDGFELIDLSPLAPAGTSSVLTTVHQNNVVTTIRNLEVAADTTNVLALECARRRADLLNKNKKSAEVIKLCSSQRLTRGQPFENKNLSAHFNVVAFCTAGRDEGNDQFEMDNLEEHIKFYLHLLNQLLVKSEMKNIILKFFDYGSPNNQKLIDRIQNKVVAGKKVELKIEKNSSFGKNYYSRLRFMIDVVNHKDQEFNYIDGGFADWTAKLLNNKKERLLTSGIGTDFLLRTVKIRD
jgi:hypothetical protein